MAATRKLPTIPIELLRRSCRRLAPKLESQVDELAGTRGTCGSSRMKNESNLQEPKSYCRIKKSVEQTNADLEVTIKQEPVISDFTDSIEQKEVPQLTKTLEKPDGFLEVDSDELDLERTLMGGQSFRWKMTKHSIGPTEPPIVIFTGIVATNVFQLWRCDDERVAYKRLNKDIIPKSEDVTQGSDQQIEQFLSDYFQLKYKLKDLYAEWSLKDDHFERCSKSYRGFRILRQDPVENVFSFICATNNNIKRISLMVDKMCQQFGDRLEVVSGDTNNGDGDDRSQARLKPESRVESTDEGPTQLTFHSFPTIERLAQNDVFDSLRYKLGFGYRAKFICETAKKLVTMSDGSQETSPRDYLLQLRRLPYKETCKRLQDFPGIGRKVADCICLMSMDHLESVPIDCHIYEIVCRNYMKTLRQERKTLTEAVHDLIGDYFKKLHGPLAGWATSVLFIGELKHLKRELGGEKETKNKKKKRL